MKKLFLLIALFAMAFTVISCDSKNPGQGSGEPGGNDPIINPTDPEETVKTTVINKAAMTTIAAGITSVYVEGDQTATIDGNSFKLYDNSFGFCNASYNAGYAALNAMQFKKKGADRIGLESTSSLGKIKEIKITYLSTSTTDYKTLTVNGSTNTTTFAVEANAVFADAVDCGVQDNNNEVYSIVATYGFATDCSYFRLTNTNDTIVLVQDITVKYEKSNSENPNPTTKTDWTSIEKNMIKNYCNNTVIPFVACDDYSLGYNSEQSFFYLLLTFNTNTVASGYIDTLGDTFTVTNIKSSNGTDTYYFDLGNKYTLEVNYTESTDYTVIQIYTYVDSGTVTPTEFLDQTDFKSTEKTLINSYLETCLPFVQCYEYEVGTDEDEYGEYLYVYFSSTSTNITTYLTSLESLYTLAEDEYGEYFTEGDMIIEYETEEDGDVVYLTLYVYAGEEIPTEFLEQTDFKSTEKTLINSYLETCVPFVQCYQYEVGTDEDEYGEYLYVYFVSNETNISTYLTSLESIYTLAEDEYGKYFTEGDMIIEYELEENNDIVYLTMYIYEGEEEGEDDPEVTDCVINSDTMKTYIGSSYNTSSLSFTFGGVTFTVPSDGLMFSNDYKSINGFQAKRNKTTFKNTTAFDSLTTITITYLNKPGTSAPNLFTILGGGTASELTLTPTSTFENTTIGKYTAYVYTYTFSESVKYVSLSTSGATYFTEINFGGTGSGGSGTGGGTTPTVDLVDDGNGYTNVDFTKADIKDVTEIGDYIDGCPTKGDVKVLVIPVDFSDCTATSKGYTIETLQNAFYGNSDQMMTYTVKDYFTKASNGKLNLTFDIYDKFFRASNTSTYYANLYNNTKNYPTDIYGYSGSNAYTLPEMLILNDALAYLDQLGWDLSQYDSDGNGTIDSVIMIYTKDYVREDDTLWWAWRYWNYLGDTSTPYMNQGYEDGYEYYYYDDVFANDYLWASYGFLFEDQEDDLLNTYTFCHELSHVLGVDDYYDYSDQYYPTHDYDMMDSMFGDHTAYSKMVLGWITNAKLVTCTQTVTLELSSIQTSDDVIILANSWDEKKGIFQEYYVIEYYTNTGANAKGGLFDTEGIIVHHVNSALEFDSESETYTFKYTNTSKSAEYTYGTKYHLYELIANGKNNYMFGVGDTMTTQKYSNGTQLGFTFKVDSISNGKATLTFTNLTYTAPEE